MKRASLLLVGILALTCAPRLLAPIQELERPTPAPTVAPTAKPRSKPVTKTERTQKSAKKSPFAGIWGGVAQSQGTDGSSGSYPWTITISDDAKEIWVTSITGQGVPWTAAMRSHIEGATLVASGEAKDKTYTATFRLSLNRNGTISFVRTAKLTDGVTVTATATLIRQ